jgi:hypothetical protein
VPVSLGGVNWSVRSSYGLRQRQAVLPNHQLPPAWPGLTTLAKLRNARPRASVTWPGISNTCRPLPSLQSFIRGTDATYPSSPFPTKRRRDKRSCPTAKVAERCPFPRVESVVAVTTPPKLPEARESLRRLLITEYIVAQHEAGCEGMLHTSPDG